MVSYCLVMISRYTADSDSAHVKFPPPLMLLLALIGGGTLQHFYPLVIFAQSWRWILATPLLFAGVVIVLYSAKLFQRAETKIQPWKTTSRIVQTGVYKYSRNPIYLAFLLFGLGVAFAFDSWWMVLSLFPVFFFLTNYVIKKEERYLEEKFGTEYVNYKSRVSRWI